MNVLHFVVFVCDTDCVGLSNSQKKCITGILILTQYTAHSPICTIHCLLNYVCKYFLNTGLVALLPSSSHGANYVYPIVT